MHSNTVTGFKSLRRKFYLLSLMFLVGCTTPLPRPDYRADHPIQVENPWLKVTQLEWGVEVACKKILVQVYTVEWDDDKACIFMVNPGQATVIMPIDREPHFDNYVFDTVETVTNRELIR